MDSKFYENGHVTRLEKKINDLVFLKSAEWVTDNIRMIVDMVRKEFEQAYSKYKLYVKVHKTMSGIHSRMLYDNDYEDVSLAEQVEHCIYCFIDRPFLLYAFMKVYGSDFRKLPTLDQEIFKRHVTERISNRSSSVLVGIVLNIFTVYILPIQGTMCNVHTPSYLLYKLSWGDRNGTRTYVRFAGDSLDNIIDIISSNKFSPEDVINVVNNIYEDLIQYKSLGARISSNEKISNKYKFICCHMNTIGVKFEYKHIDMIKCPGFLHLLKLYYMLPSGDFTKGAKTSG